MIPASVVIDTQNFYGFSARALGPRAKADPSGIVKAFRYLGFEVDEVHVAVAKPAQDDAQEAANRLCSVRERLNLVLTRLSFLASKVPSGIDGCLVSASQACTRAIQELHGVGQVHSGLLAFSSLHKDAGLASARLEDARHHLQEARNSLLALPVAPVSSELVVSALRVAELEQELQRLSERLGNISMYLYGAASNIEYLNLLSTGAHAPLRVHVSQGRWPIGRDGGAATEKRVDTICAVELLEATRAALSAAPRAVILVSDDDDLSPAATRAVSIAQTQNVSVIVAGTAALSRRWRGTATHEPAWLHLDASTVCRMAGLDPANVAKQRSELATLALGLPIRFTQSSAGRVTSPAGLTLEWKGLPLIAPTNLYAGSLVWGRNGEYGVPRVELSPMVGNPLAVKGRATLRGHANPQVRVTPYQVPVSAGGPPLAAQIEAPGWWQVGSQLVIAEVPTQTGTVWKVVGPDPTSPAPPTLLDAREAVVQSLQHPFAKVTSGGESWDVFEHSGRLGVGGRVIIWPYGASGSNAVLLSSVL
ncbi:MAG: hypothetical protein ABSA65_14945 [Acidimicrobiales bacterium]